MAPHQQILDIATNDWREVKNDPQLASALESGRALFFPTLPFSLNTEEQALLSPQLLAPKVRNISPGADSKLKGVANNADATRVFSIMSRFRQQAQELVNGLFPKYRHPLTLGATSLRPMPVSHRKQSWRADDRRLHVDAFPSRPNYGERILRVFTNINPHGEARVWRLGEAFESMATTMLPRVTPYRAWQANLLNRTGITKSFRSEYDHLMLQLPDAMKADMDYQKTVEQITMPFPPGATWICFSDQASHAVVSGQHMMEQTFNLPITAQYHPEKSPLAVLSRLTGRKLLPPTHIDAQLAPLLA